jgi:glyoxylase-like metal-dependent hydrolase (beta-lactamase superfamily II)
MKKKMKRRQLFKYAGVLGIMASISPTVLKAQIPQPGLGFTSPLGHTKFRLGELDMMVVTDGHIFIHPAQPIFAPGINKIQVNNALVENFMFEDAVDAAINILVIKKDKRTIVIDAGSGSALGNQAGKFKDNLKSAGIAADQVTDVFITHLHVDHIGGILDKDGNPVFKNAVYYLSEKEYNFWMSNHPDFSQSKSPESNKGSITLAQNTISAIKDKLNLYTFGDTFFGCITPDLAEGHTPGHPVLKIFSGDKVLTHIVDTVHTPLLLSHPEWGTEWDIDFHKGVATRKKILRDQYFSKGLTMSCHLPWPGLGYITEREKGYAWVPMPISTPLI